MTMHRKIKCDPGKTHRFGWDNIDNRPDGMPWENLTCACGERKFWDYKKQLVKTYDKIHPAHIEVPKESRRLFKTMKQVVDNFAK